MKVLLRQIFKPTWLGLFSVMLMASACNPVPELEEVVIVDSEEGITKEDVRQALMEIEYVCHCSQSIDCDGSITNVYRIEIYKSSLKVKGKDLKITKSEFYVDGELTETEYSDNGNCNCGFIYKIEPSDMVKHKFETRVYGATCPENETYRTFSWSHNQ